MHRVVFREEGMFAGWPSNHGAWQWGDEFLVGFMTDAVRKGGKSDIGYPRLFRRQDGDIVCVYHWAVSGQQQGIEATRIKL